MRLDLLQPALCFLVCAAGGQQRIRRRCRDARVQARVDVVDQILEIDRARGRVRLLLPYELLEFGSSRKPDPAAGVGVSQILRAFGHDEVEDIVQLVGRRQVRPLVPFLLRVTARAEIGKRLPRAFRDRIRSSSASLQVLLDRLGDDGVVGKDSVNRRSERILLRGLRTKRLLLDGLIRCRRLGVAAASGRGRHLRSSRAERSRPSDEARYLKEHARAEASSGLSLRRDHRRGESRSRARDCLRLDPSAARSKVQGHRPTPE